MKKLNNTPVTFEELLNMDYDCRPKEVIVEVDKLLPLLNTIRTLKAEVIQMNEIVKELKEENAKC